MRRLASLVLLLASYTACAAVGVTVPVSTLGRGLNSGVAELTRSFHLIELPRFDDSVTFVAESPSR